MNTLTLKDFRAYIVATALVIANVLLPQLFHAVPDGGRIWLPIFFFTLVGSWRYGLQVGLLTAALSPLCSAMLFGMPGAAMLPVIIAKSLIIATTAATASRLFGQASVLKVAFVALVAYGIGTLFEWAYTANSAIAFSDLLTSIPGIVAQIFIAPMIIRFKNEDL